MPTLQMFLCKKKRYGTKGGAKEGQEASAEEDAEENSLQEETPKPQAECAGQQGQGQQAQDCVPPEGEHSSGPNGHQHLADQEQPEEEVEDLTSALASQLQQADMSGGASHLGHTSNQAAQQAASEQWAARRTGTAIAQMLGAVHASLWLPYQQHDIRTPWQLLVAVNSQGTPQGRCSLICWALQKEGGGAGGKGE
eukprot:1156553-Pelagomonas_calceolata.AAC.2